MNEGQQVRIVTDKRQVSRRELLDGMVAIYQGRHPRTIVCVYDARGNIDRWEYNMFNNTEVFDRNLEDPKEYPMYDGYENVPADVEYPYCITLTEDKFLVEFSEGDNRVIWGDECEWTDGEKIKRSVDQKRNLSDFERRMSITPKWRVSTTRAIVIVCEAIKSVADFVSSKAIGILIEK